MLQNESYSEAAEMAGSLVAKTMPRYKQLNENETLIINELFFLHQRIVYPLLINSSIPDIKVGYWQAKGSCHYAEDFHSPPFVGDLTGSPESMALVCNFSLNKSKRS